MKTLKSLFVISAMSLMSGYTFAGPGDSKNVNSSVREKIASAIQSADIQGQGQVTLKFGVTEDNNLQLLKIESSDMSLNREVKNVLSDSKIKFPKGSSGIYTINLRVNSDTEAADKEAANYTAIRDQVMDVVSDIKTDRAESVDVKLRVVNPYYVKVMKAESSDPNLAAKVKKTLEKERLYVPKNLNGDYTVKVTFK